MTEKYQRSWMVFYDILNFLGLAKENLMISLYEAFKIEKTTHHQYYRSLKREVTIYTEFLYSLDFQHPFTKIQMAQMNSMQQCRNYLVHNTIEQDHSRLFGLIDPLTYVSVSNKSSIKNSIGQIKTLSEHIFFLIASVALQKDTEEIYANYQGRELPQGNDYELITKIKWVQRNKDCKNKIVENLNIVSYICSLLTTIINDIQQDLSKRNKVLTTNSKKTNNGLDYRTLSEKEKKLFRENEMLLDLGLQFLEINVADFCNPINLHDFQKRHLQAIKSFIKKRHPSLSKQNDAKDLIANTIAKNFRIL